MAQVPATRRGQGGRLAARREHPLERLHRDFDSLLAQLWGGWLTPVDQDLETMRMWDFGIKEDDREIVVRAELPGFEENEIDVQINKVLTIKAEKQQKDEQHEEYRNFYRSIALPSGVDAAKARAAYRNGVLELHIPRAEEARPRRIAVEGQHTNGGSSVGEASPDCFSDGAASRLQPEPGCRCPAREDSGQAQEVAREVAMEFQSSP